MLLRAMAGSGKRLAELELERLVREASEAGVDSGSTALVMVLCALAEVHRLVAQAFGAEEGDALIVRVCRRALEQIVPEDPGRRNGRLNGSTVHGP